MKKKIVYCCSLLLFLGASILSSTSSGSHDTSEFNPSQLAASGPTLELSIEETLGLFSINIIVKNTGDAGAHNVKLYSISFEGQVLYNNRTSEIDTFLGAGEYTRYKTDLQAGFGSFVVTMTITCDEGATDTKSANGFAIGPFCFIP